LQQRISPRTAARLDSVANGIAELVINSDGSVMEHAGATRLVSELATAGISSDGGIPYSRSMDVLVAIARSARDTRIRGQIMWLLPQLPNRERAFDFLRSIAGAAAPPGDDLAPRVALGVLLSYADHDAAALRVVRGLWDGKLVSDESARTQLELFAKLRGWTAV
jgi:hypothetical protein